ncbi:MAG: M3 family oligoendopeptidase, partial [Chloroflexota bacterium]
MTEKSSLPARSEVPLEQTWALESIFSTPTDWENACKELEQLLPSLTVFQGRLHEGPQVLIEAIQKLEEVGTLIGKIGTYASNESSVDTFDQAATARAGQARSLGSRAGAAMAFFDPELMSIGFNLLKQWMQETPALAFFAQYVDRLEKRSAHVRSGEVEEVLALSADAFSGAFNIFNMLNNADLKFQPAVAADGTQLEIGQSSIGSLITHPDRQVRRSAWQNYADGYLGFKNTSAAILTTAIKQDVFNARVRGYPDALHASLEPNNVPVEVFHNLIDVFKTNLPTWHKYWRIRRKALKLDSFGVYDIKAPLTESKPIVRFEQAVDWICEGMAPLGAEYVQILRRGCLEDRWVDRALNRGKREGAFSSGAYGTRPFIMMSYADDLFSLSTLAHELGHSMHSYYSRTNQRYLY